MTGGVLWCLDAGDAAAARTRTAGSAEGTAAISMVFSESEQEVRQAVEGWRWVVSGRWVDRSHRRAVTGRARRPARVT